MRGRSTTPVIGVVGQNGSGKDELASYLAGRCGFVVFRTGDLARREAKRRDLAGTRRQLQKISEELLERHGPGWFARRLIDEIHEAGRPPAIVNGVRTPDDVSLLRRTYGDAFVLVAIEVPDPEIRFLRLKRRSASRDPMDRDEFMDEERRAQRLFHVDEAMAQADVTIRNDNSLQSFYQRIETRLIQGGLGAQVHCDGPPRREGVDR